MYEKTLGSSGPLVTFKTAVPFELQVGGVMHGRKFSISRTYAF
jgi:hypothetical protein